ncbi:aldehyde dehydrogenase (NAD+) [Hasllibacter halocynthiae]|uniref:aldehyde dehydrogenase (NAD(+)) n=1 Tax=Hasllibacter halocynthiae TaxID=595589 RepID=A0A2T0X1I5_9RHOB|nr:aldehyde dehydrogenase family protein [Hasllibacter halocynthiae]PRY92755.1 aldehyde dehydrogenase (NAD+) [Hasllibacter halocynthiae]
MLGGKRHYIDGAWRDGAGEAMPVIDPATEEEVATIALGTAEEVDAAVAAARRALPGWMATGKAERGEWLGRLMGAYKARAGEMGEAIRLEMGAPLDLARRNQVGAGSFHMRGFAEAWEAFDPEEVVNGDLVRREAVGVCALVTPWNWPMNQIVLKVVPAILTGNAVVLKPSEVAPLSAMLFADIVAEAGLPAGVFNLVNGDGAGAGSALSAHPGVDMVSFTGSTRAGTAISRAASDTLKRVTLELGGKGANLVFADARADAVADGVAHCFRNTGQSCNAPTRMLVERPRYDEAVAQAARAAEGTRVGPTAEAGDHIGPLVSRAQWDKVQELIAAGEGEARLVAGGTGLPEGVNRGYYVRPTVFVDVSNDMRIAREEIFGPVLSIIPFDTEEEAVAIANDTPYGLTNYVQTEDLERAARVSRALRSGMVEVNGADRANGLPFGGMKQSGNGREAGRWGLEDFTEVKVISGRIA